MNYSNRIPLEKIRAIDPELNNLSDKELLEVRDTLYELGELALDSWITKNQKEKEIKQ